jgi:hypothetical protein
MTKESAAPRAMAWTAATPAARGFPSPILRATRAVTDIPSPMATA